MDCFMNNKTLQYYEYKTLNKCRIYLQVFTLADIVTGDGKRIQKNTWEGKKPTQLRPISNWPRWGKPSLAEWKIWRKAITNTFLQVTDRNLKQYLGAWVHKPENKWSIDIRDETLWEEKDKEWKCWKKVNRSYRLPRYKEDEYTIQSNHPPQEFILPTAVYHERNMIFQEGSTPIFITKPTQKPQHAYKRWLHRNIRIKGTMNHLLQCLKN